LSVMRRPRLKDVTVRGSPIGLRWEVPKSERDLLHSLFVALGDEPALQAEAIDFQAVCVAVESIRAQLTSTLSELGADAVVAPSLELLRSSCHEYLDITSNQADWQKVAHLRASFCMVAESIATGYKLRSAERLVSSMQMRDF
jgi:hypothetical protein